VRTRVYQTASGAGGGSSSGGSSGSDGDGCYSSTIGKDDDACVQIDSGDWYQCDGGPWVVRESDPTAWSSVTAY
jgi:hypothetical protein